MSDSPPDWAALYEAQRVQMVAQSAQLDRLSGLVARSLEAKAETDTVLVSELIGRYEKNQRAVNPKWAKGAYRIEPLLEWFGKMRACDVTVLGWEEYTAARMAGTLSRGRHKGKPIIPSTMNLELPLLRGIFRWAIRRKLLTSNPLAEAEAIKKATSTPQPAFCEEDLGAVLRCCPNLMTQVYIVVGLDSGLRRAENISLRPSDVRKTSRILHVIDGKGGKSRDVVTTSRAIDFLYRLPMDGPWVYLNRITDEHYDKATMNRWVQSAMRDAGMDDKHGRRVRIHSLRRGHGTNAVERGVDIRSVQAQLGHSTLKTTEGYVDSRMGHRVRMMAEKFEAGVGLRELPRRGPKRAGEETPLPALLKIVK